MKVCAISGFGVKGPAAFLLEAGHRRILLDLGEGPEAGVRPDPASIRRLDAIILSHAHADHCGALELAPTLGDPTIWCTPLVADLVCAGRFGVVRHLPAMGEAMVEGLPVLTGRAGHAPGGVWMRIGGEHGLLYSGDVSYESLLFPADTLPRAAALIVDASYGDYDTRLDRGIDHIAERAANRPLLLPAPAGGRGIEMAVVLHERGFRVGLCPAHLALARVLIAAPGLIAPGAATRLEAAVRAAAPLVLDSVPQGVMIAATADAESGMAAELVRRWAGDASVRIIFTGYLAAGSPAMALVQEGQAEVVRWNVHPRLSDLRSMINQTQAQFVMPAFLAADAIPDLAAALELGDRLAGPEFDLAG
ncbi:MAG TPA: MBL fold metallo-hydrolase [Devosiaceae bacterium]|jgi:predicted metal-dependent RNase|nr:MBL fold metallo-hydrolase [Devosiaceae bacterium]